MTFAPLCGAFPKNKMSYTPMSDLGQQGLFDITRTLLQQPDLASLCEALSQLVKAFCARRQRGYCVVASADSTCVLLRVA